MSRGYSRVILVGNIGRDPEMRYSQNGTPRTSFSLAVNRRRRDQSGQFQDETSWFRVTLFRTMAENANEWLRKGSRVLVEGQLQVRQYTDANGTPRTSVDVLADTFMNLSPRDEGGDGAYGGYQNRAAGGQGGAGTPRPSADAGRTGQAQQQDDPFDDYDIDDVPF